MKTRYFIICGLAACGMLLAGCVKQLEQSNPNMATESIFWQTEEDFDKGLTSCYAALKGFGGYFGVRGVELRICRGDDVTFRNDLQAIKQLGEFINDASNGQISSTFNNFYTCIYRSNLTRQHLEEISDQFSSDFVNRVRGECLFIRGLSEHLLAREFRAAPLRLVASQSPEDFQLANSSQEEIWKQAIADLTEAASLLPVKNPVAGRPTKGACYAVIGKTYVYLEDFDNAIKALEPLTKSPYTYALGDFKWNFDEAHENDLNPESIFEVLIDTGGGTSEWSSETANTAQTNVRPCEFGAPEIGGWYEATATQKMMDIFLAEPDKDGNVDYRARMSVAWDYPGCIYYKMPFQERFTTESSRNTYWVLKYQNWDTRDKEPQPVYSAINERAIRYADVILLLAESYLRKSSPDFGKAVSYINMIRERANLNPYGGGMDYQAIFNDLEHQRAIEFFIEGQRFYDLRRWGLLEQRLKEGGNDARYQQYMSGKSGNGNKFDYFPIPTGEITTNLLCEQDPLWR